MGAATTAISAEPRPATSSSTSTTGCTQMDDMREFFWSARVAQWAPVAGLIAVVRVRRGAIAALLAGWLAAFLVVKGFSPRADIESGSFWRLLMPAWPAYLLLLRRRSRCSIPTLARRLGERLRRAVDAPVALRWIAVAAALTVLVPAARDRRLRSTARRAVFTRCTQDDAGNFILTPGRRERGAPGRVAAATATG